ncbi:8-amino-7-oxononanoate synthase [Kitasatospora sp. MAA4]|nr:8-amino-7-oxononanoate synthase [Kitasatospora sp. MAA4]
MRDIAIVGMGCRFPGAANVSEYWRILRSGERQFRAVPPERWDHSLIHTPQDRRARAGAYTDRLATIDGVDQFDARHYRMSPRRVQSMDPQHRLLLDASREALQDAGWERREFDRESTGVFFGLNINEYLELIPDVLTMPSATLPGALLNMAAANVSQHFNLHGPSFAVDAACSATLVALHQALGHLASGECRVALVGGAYLALEPRTLLAFSKVGAISAGGVCRPFDKDADGFVLGDGAGVVVLRPLEDALAAGDRVYAVIQGIGSSNDGIAEGPMTPRSEGQLTALRRAYADAGFSAGSVGFFEAHGTATVVGDRAELDAITELRRSEPTEPTPAYLSSVKSLIGHSLGASGAASLIKTALMLHHGTVVPMPPTDSPRPDDLAAAGLRIPQAAVPWEHPGATPRRAGVSNFGFGGTNVHVVLEEAPQPEPGDLPDPAAQDRPELFVFSAATLDRLESHLVRFLEALQDTPEPTLPAIARTLASRQLLPARLSVVAGTPSELRARVQQARSALALGRVGALGEGLYAAAGTVPQADRAIALIFPGQGSQRPGMARDLYERFPAVRAGVDYWDALATAEPGGFPLLDAVYGPDSDSSQGRRRLTGTDVCQPVLGAFGVALARFARGLGVEPAVSFGHSVGEFPAAVLAGALDDAECAGLLLSRGATMRAAEAVRSGGMVAVRATREQAESLSEGLADVWVACWNHPRQVVFSGTREALAELTLRCERVGLTATALQVSNGFHSPLLDPVLAELTGDLTERRISSPEGVFVSSVSGAVEQDPAVLRELWGRHAGSPVLFADSVGAAFAAGARVFVQVCGGSGLLGAVLRCVPEPERVHCVALTGEEPDDARTFLAALGQLAVLGVDVDLAALVPAGASLATLPPSPLATESHWRSVVASRVPGPPTAPGLAAVESGGPAAVSARRPARPAQPSAAPVPAPTPTPAPVAVPVRAAAEHPERQDTVMNDVVELLRQQLTLLQAYAAPAQAPAPAQVPARVGAAAVNHPLIEQWSVGIELPARSPAQLLPPVAAEAARVRELVYAEISAVSAFPVTQLSDEVLVGQDLGFDSLMVTELLERLRRAFPVAADRMVEGFLPKQPTIAQVIEVTAELLGVPAAPRALASAPVELAPVELESAPAEHRIEDFPELIRLEARIAGLGERNPYFLLHEGTMRDTTRVGDQELISFSGYNYLGLSGHPVVTAAVKEAVDRYGSSVSASRFLSGDRPLHRELEAELADLNGCEAAIALVSGHATNVSVIGHLMGPQDLILHDSLAHDSILQGCKLSGARRRPFPHNDMAALDALLRKVRHEYRRVLIVVEGVYSMDGDLVDLPALIEVKQRHGAMVLVDEAHSLGTVGAGGGGVGEHFAVDRSDIDLWAGTLSKSLAGCGGYVAGSERTITYLKCSVPGFVYSVGLTPANTAASLAAIRVMRDEPERLKRLAENSDRFLRLAREAGIDTGDSYGSPVIPAIVKDSAKAVQLSAALFDRGVSANPILHPAVAEELTRLRFFVTSEHTAEQIDYSVATLAEQWQLLNR